jgi:hypothetical protein
LTVVTSAKVENMTAGEMIDTISRWMMVIIFPADLRGIMSMNHPQALSAVHQAMRTHHLLPVIIMPFPTSGWIPKKVTHLPLTEKTALGPDCIEFS